ncbi:UNVERIFIED_CONTAM: hypothetical protein NCL1_17935 [Trichonephila clavipes]
MMLFEKDLYSVQAWNAVAVRSESSTRVVAHHRVQALNLAGYLLRLSVGGTVMAKGCRIYSLEVVKSNILFKIRVLNAVKYLELSRVTAFTKIVDDFLLGKIYLRSFSSPVRRTGIPAIHLSELNLASTKLQPSGIIIGVFFLKVLPSVVNVNIITLIGIRGFYANQSQRRSVTGLSIV